jgi:hypothetical protein
VNDRKPWSESDILDLQCDARAGDTLEEAAGFLCRAGTIDDARRKAEELGLRFHSRSDA